MTALLYRIGAFAARRKWTVLGAWIVLFGALATVGFGFGGKLADSFTIPGTESQAALDRLDAVFPQAAGGSAQAIVVAKSGHVVTDASERTAIADMVTAIGRIKGVESVASPFSTYATNAVSGSKQAAIIAVQFRKVDADVPTSTVDALTKTASIGGAAGMQVAYSGQVFQTSSVAVSPVEGLGVLFAAIVLIITFGSLLAAGLPLLTAIIGVVLSFAAIRVAALFVTVSSSAPTLALMLGLAVGIDYGLFVASRHREQLATGMPIAESLATAVATAGTAVAFAGTTVIIALLGLLVVGIPFLSIMGVGAAFAVLVAVCASVTLLPALLALGGRRFVPKPGSRTARRAIATRGDSGTARTMGARWVGLLAKVPVVGVIIPVLVLGALAIPAASLQLSLPNNGSQPIGTTERTAYDLTAKHFGDGRNGPLVLLVDITQDNDFTADLKSLAARIKRLPDVAAVGTATPNATLDTAILQVIPKSGPAAPGTLRLVEDIRALEPTFEKDYALPVSVTGSTAIQLDISDRLLNALVPFALVVVGLSVLLLMIVFRSLIVPLKAALGFLLSYLAGLGVTVALVQRGGGADFLGVQAGPLLSFMPVLVMAILFGLSMDYEVFLVSGMRESWVHGGDAKAAVRRGFTHGARVVTAAALIMIFVFTSFIPDGSDVIKPIAIALASGIAFDAFLVRMTLVPSLMFLVGRAAWYLPRWLERIVPHVDIEGAGLVAQRAEQSWAEGERDWAISGVGVRAAAPFTGDPVSVHVRRGDIASITVAADARRAIVATLAGHLEPAAGHLQVAGHPVPADSRAVRRIAGPVFDDGTASRATVGDLMRERLRYAPRDRRRGTVSSWLGRLLLADPSGVPRIPDPARTLGSFVAEERLTLLAVAALAGGAEVLVVDVGDLSADAQRRFAVALAGAIDGRASALLVSSPAAVLAAPARQPLTVKAAP